MLRAIMCTSFEVKTQKGKDQGNYYRDRKCFISTEQKDLRTSTLVRRWSMRYQLPRPTTGLWRFLHPGGAYRVGRTRRPRNLSVLQRYNIKLPTNRSRYFCQKTWQDIRACFRRSCRLIPRRNYMCTFQHLQQGCVWSNKRKDRQMASRHPNIQ